MSTTAISAKPVAYDQAPIVPTAQTKPAAEATPALARDNVSKPTPRGFMRAIEMGWDGVHGAQIGVLAGAAAIKLAGGAAAGAGAGIGALAGIASGEVARRFDSVSGSVTAGALTGAAIAATGATVAALKVGMTNAGAVALLAAGSAVAGALIGTVNGAGAQGLSVLELVERARKH